MQRLHASMRNLPKRPNCRNLRGFLARCDGRFHTCSGNVMRESQQIAAEHRGDAAHTHRAGAEHRGNQDHPTGSESSRQALEHSNRAYLQTQRETHGAPMETGNHAATEREVAALAHKLWQDRGCPEGSPEEDWLRAVEELRSRH